MSKEEAWKIYRGKLLASLKSSVWALGISILFYLSAVSHLEPGKHLEYFLISVMHGLVIFAWIWVLNSIVWAAVIHFNLKVHPEETRLAWSIQITLSIFGTVAGLVCARWVQAKILGKEFSVDGLTESILYGLFISMMFMFYYAYRESRVENLELKAAKTEAELHVLKNQMQPHFLFNSLNSLSELIASNQQDASLMTQNLADLYREILENSKNQLASVQSELSIINKYLALEKIRFGDRLNYAIETAPEVPLQSILIPSLMLQTLVENAVKHGIAKSPEGGRVLVKILKNGTGYIAEIHNTGQPFDDNANRGGTGIANTRSRLERFYGDRHKFNLHQQEDAGTLARFWFSGAMPNA